MRREHADAPNPSPGASHGLAVCRAVPVLTHIDETLEAFLRATAPLSAVDIDVSFEPPTEEWAAKLTRPTVSVHLWDIRRSTARAVTGVETFERDGVQMRRMALPRVELSYAISVWTTEYEDERTLMGALLGAMLGHSEVPHGYLAPSLADLPAPTVSVARADDSEVYRFDSRMKTPLNIRLVAVVDTGAGVPTATSVGEISLGLNDLSTGAKDAPLRRIAGECADPAAVGATVRSPYGVATVNVAGRFLINARPGDELVIEIDPPQTAVVPAAGGVLVGS